MQKRKHLLHVLALAIAVPAAIASSKPSSSSSLPQYYKVGDQYYYAGIQGIDYVCEAATTICTYSYNPATGEYRPNKIGRIAFLR